MSTTTTEKGPPPGRKPRGGSGPRPVPLHKRSSSHFQPGDRQRGDDYFDEGRVQLAVNGGRAMARVAGTEHESYTVEVDWSEVPESRLLRASCTCQRFAGGRPCKHLWATLLAIGSLDPSVQPPGRGRLALRKERPTEREDDPGQIEQRARVHLARPRRQRKAAGPRGRSRGRRAGWQDQLGRLREELEGVEAETPGDGQQQRPQAPPNLRLLINTAASEAAGAVVIDLFQRRGGGKSGKLKRATLATDELAALLAQAPDGNTSQRAPALVTAFAAAPPLRKGRGPRGRKPVDAGRAQQFRLPARLHAAVLPQLAEAGLLGWWDGRNPANRRQLSWDSGQPWRLALRLQAAPAGAVKLGGSLERGDDSVPLDAVQLVLPPDGDDTALVVAGASLGRLMAGRARDIEWCRLLRHSEEILIPKEELEEALTQLHEIGDLPQLELPTELGLFEEREEPAPRLVLEQDAASVLPNAPLVAELSFVYGSMEVSAADSRSTIVDWPRRTVLRRDMDWEHAALVRLLEAGVRPVPAGKGHELELPPQEVPVVAEPLLADGWTVEVHGSSLRSPSPPALRVESGIDWFELSGELDFAGEEIDISEVLAALARGDRFVSLGDGSRGLLPASVSEAYGSLAQLAHSTTDTGLRFIPSQALLVDALLAQMPEPEVDQGFSKLRDKLRSFDRIKPKKEPRSFRGTLRGYQRDGLGWLDFLREFGLGGVLADDMGLGKTVQVLALLRTHRTASKTTGLPWLVVAPRSLVYNWLDEAQRFTPDLKVVEYGGPGREALQARLGDYDLVVTTYGTLRRDVGFLVEVEFDTIILDEAQAIKNRESQAAKASRLLVGRHRLALTGTPIENHLGELGSLFDFLNPGLLGRLPTLEVLTSGRTASQQELALVAEGIRPFILRRTKSQVLPDLPPKTEQVLLCTLNDRQREIYDQVKRSYQASLLRQVESKGVAGSTIQVLEALLRLRQIACHPGLVDDDWVPAGSSKLEALYEQVAEVLDEGHKVLVFSQFTQLLAFVRRHLDEQGVEYAYLDGQTRKRGEVVDRFQNDPDCNLFLVSLKAGGLGLNLTAAGYVFLIDPWWNPAVEAQAIDRAHRIGQTQPVFAYRLIARDTVEEKILELQRSKRKIAEAILDGGGEPLKQLTAEDLQMLLS